MKTQYVHYINSNIDALMKVLDPQSELPLMKRFGEGFDRIEAVAQALHDLRKECPNLSCEHFRDARAQAQYAKVALENAYVTQQSPDTCECADLITSYIWLACSHIRLLKNHFEEIPAIKTLGVRRD